MTTAQPILQALANVDTVIIDTETSSLYPWRDGKILAGIAIRPLGDGRDDFYLTVRHDDSKNGSLKQVRELKQGLEGKTLVFHNAKFDLAVLWQDGLDLTEERIIDTMVLWRLVSEDEISYELKHLAQVRFKIPGAGDSQRALKALMKKNKWETYNQVPATMMAEYAGDDLEYTNVIYDRGMPLVDKRGLTDLLEKEIELTPDLFHMERKGFQLDRKFVEDSFENLTEMLVAKKEELYYVAKKELNRRWRIKESLAEPWDGYLEVCREMFAKENGAWKPLSSTHIKKIFHALGYISTLQTKKKKKKDGTYSGGGESWAKDALALIDHPLADGILEYRGLKNVFDYYRIFLKLMDEDDVIHCNIMQSGTKTGRFSCREPNLQNLPRDDQMGSIEQTKKELKKRDTVDNPPPHLREVVDGVIEQTELLRHVRGAFVPRKGKLLLFFDWSQVELRIFAAYAGEKAMLQAFSLGLDIHSLTAMAAYGPLASDANAQLKKWWRQLGKDLGFGLLYGIGPTALGKRIDRKKDEAWEFMQTYFKRFPKARRLIKTATNMIFTRMHESGRDKGWVKNLWGRRRYLDSDTAWLAPNFLVQGSSADLMKVKFHSVSALLAPIKDTDLLLPIHDEFVVETTIEQAEKVIKLVVTEMEECELIKAPLKVDIKYSYESWSKAKKLECEICGGHGANYDIKDSELFQLLYDEKLEGRKFKASTCGKCGGAGYDIFKLHGIAA